MATLNDHNVYVSVAHHSLQETPESFPDAVIWFVIVVPANHSRLHVSCLTFTRLQLQLSQIIQLRID